MERDIQIEVETLIDAYRQEIARLQDENLALRIRLLQIERDLKKEGADGTFFFRSIFLP